MGAFDAKITPGATLLATINVFLEIVRYWNSGLPKWYVWAGTLVMGLLGVWCVVALKF